MEEDIQYYEKQIILLRKQLAELEIKRSQYQSNVPAVNLAGAGKCFASARTS